jgi:hypothetical protein
MKENLNLFTIILSKVYFFDNLAANRRKNALYLLISSVIDDSLERKAGYLRVTALSRNLDFLN